MRRFGLLMGLVLLLSACVGGGNYAPVLDGSSRRPGEGTTHVVSAGDTLFSIAWRYGLDFRGLARANGIAPPYVIYAGQRLVLKEVDAVAVGRSDTRPPATPPPKNSRDLTAPSSRKIVSRPVVGEVPPEHAFRFDARLWRWPAKGELVRKFDGPHSTHKGIDIAGKLGEPVLAANAGKVVYAGSGLVGYGNLVIVKHSEEYLSAYGHNRKLLVREGQWIKVGQPIAEIGDSGTDSVKLHFEVRREGNPVDPLKVLPRR